MKHYTIASLSAINTVAKAFISDWASHKVWAFYGPMGVGKTTFIKALCEVLGVQDTVNSPSFAIVNEYQTTHHDTVYHFDFYRLKDLEEAYDMGYEEYLYSGAYCMIEWPEKIEPLLPDDCLHLTLNENSDGSRTLTVR